MKPSQATRILIAEDEVLMRERLLRQLAELWPSADIVAVAENGNDAWDQFLEHAPDVVFLDIRMPGYSGIQLAGRMTGRTHIVFITAYDQHAVDAFEAGAIDYLLKPVTAERLQKTILRLQEKIPAAPADLGTLLQQLQANAAPPKQPLKWLKASVGKQIRLIAVDDILFLQSDTKYTRIVLANYEALIRTPLKDLIEQLDEQHFWQIHRATIVNANAVAAAERIDAERMELLLKNHPERLLVSRNFTHLFRD